MKFVQVMHSGFWKGCQTSSSCWCQQSANQHTLRWISEPKVQFWWLLRPPNNCPPIDEAYIHFFGLGYWKVQIHDNHMCHILLPLVANWVWNKAMTPLHWDKAMTCKVQGSRKECANSFSVSFHIRKSGRAKETPDSMSEWVTEFFFVFLSL